MAFENFCTYFKNFIPKKNLDQPLVRMQYLMGTLVTIEVAGMQEAPGIEAIYAAFEEMRRIENLLSRFIESSDISRLNATPQHKSKPISRECKEVLQASVFFGELSQGQFDVTLAGIQDLWRQAKVNKKLPDKSELDQALNETGYQHIFVDKNKGTVLIASNGVSLDLGGIGKGYAVDKAVDCLKDLGVKEATINAGGNIYHLSATEQPFGIKNPQDPNADPIAVIQLCDQALATTANYEQGFEIGGKSYGHILNAQTGYPCESNILSTSVIAESAMIADALSTCLFLMGDKLVNALNELGCKTSLTTVNGTHLTLNIDSRMLLTGVSNS